MARDLPDRLTPAHRVIARSAADVVDAAADFLRDIDLRTYYGWHKGPTKQAILTHVQNLREEAEAIRRFVARSDERDHLPQHVDGQMPLFEEDGRDTAVV